MYSNSSLMRLNAFFTSSPILHKFKSFILQNSLTTMFNQSKKFSNFKRKHKNDKDYIVVSHSNL